MGELAIRVEGLGKRYRLQAGRPRYKMLRDVLRDAALKPLRGLRRLARREPASASDARSFWAIRDVSFEVNRGEVIGIIGRNGAGKSTLLKVLSRITDPTEGGVDLWGRVGSLLEVGTGFHHELSGRDNVYLNGAMLGMGRSDITRKFDEIVAFAEVEKFVDTPVKHYSSGMYLRLAFAVAAHLEPEILIVDEVLAVGDAAFQNKCLGKMGEVGRSGTTVLFVSHQLATVKTLCQRVITLAAGRIAGQGDPESQVSEYLGQMSRTARAELSSREDREGNGAARVTAVTFTDSEGNTVPGVLSGSSLRISVQYASEFAGRRPSVLALTFWNAEGHKVFHLDSRETVDKLPVLEREGEYACVLPRLPLPPGLYTINAYLAVDGYVADHVHGAAMLEIWPGDFFGTGRAGSAHGGVVLVDHYWK
jgi:lipopolysaccharide transport system ATP-binding protein